MQILSYVLAFLAIFESVRAFRLQTAAKSSSLQMALSDYKKELAETAAKIAGPGLNMTCLKSISNYYLNF